MSFLSPWFLAGAAAAALPIVLHLLKRNPEVRVKFAAVALLRQAPAESADRRHLRDLLLLALRVAALLLLAVAFARPFLRASAATGVSGLTVVALDTSMSLSAPGQFARAIAKAREAIGRAPGGDLVAVVTFADTAQEAAGPSGDRALARAAIDAARPGFGSTRYRSALERASDMIVRSGAGTSRIVVVTDLQASGWDTGDRAAVPESTRIEIDDVGAPPPNLAITALGRSADKVVATVFNAGPVATEATLSVTGSDGQRPSGGTATASVGPGESVDVVLPRPESRWVKAEIADPGGVQGDNARYAVLDTTDRPSIVVVTASGDLSTDAFYLQQALAAADTRGARDVEGVGVTRLSSWDARRMRAASVVVLVSTRGIERRGRELLAEYLKNGGRVLIVSGADLDQEVVAEIFGNPKTVVLVPPASGLETGAALPTLAPADVRHPIFQAFGAGAGALGLVRFRRWATLDTSDCQVIARFTNGQAALADCAAGEGRALVFASDLDNKWNDFPLRASFVPFVHEALRYLAGGRHLSREYMVGGVPGIDADTPGVRSLTGDGAEAGLVAVNVDPKESDPRRLSMDEFQDAVARLKDSGNLGVSLEARQQEDRQHLWQYVLALVALTLGVESVVAQRAA